MSSERQRSQPAQPGVDYARGEETGERPPRRSTVILGIIAASVLFVAVVSLLLFRSLAGREPSHVAYVQGNEKWLGAELILTGPSLTHPYGAVLDRSDRFSVPFFVPAGQYTLVVRVGGAEVHRQQFELGAERVHYLSLAPDGPATRPAE